MPGAAARVTLYAALFFAAQTAVVVTGLCDGGILSDDAFYYFQIAREAALGHGFTFDGLSPTNGFHPLFAWICVPIFRLWSGDPWLPVRAALIVLAAASAGAALALFRLGRAAQGDRAGELMAGLWLLSPFTWILTLRGCEGPLSVLGLALAFGQAARLGRGWRDAALLGVLLGLAGLARTDNLLFAAPVLLVLAAHRTRSWRSVAIAGAAAALVVSPWLLWSWLEVGTIVQVSGAVKQKIGLYGRFPPVEGPLDWLRNLYQPFAHTARFVVGEEWRPPVWGPQLGLASGALLGAALIAGGRRRPAGIVLAACAYFVLHLVFYALIVRNYYNWYFLPVVFCAAVVQGERLAGARTPVAIALVAAQAALCLLVARGFVGRVGIAPADPERYARGVLAPIPPAPEGTRVGLFNAARVGYFAAFLRPELRIVNLDCVVNNALYDAWRDRRYPEWLLANVDWLAEGAGGFEQFITEPVTRRLAATHLVTYHGQKWLRRVVADPLDPRVQAARPPGARVIFDFERGDLDGWTVSGDAFAVTSGRPPGDPPVAGFQGRRLLASWGARRDRATGRALSPPFVIDGRRLGFLIGGGDDPERLRASLLVDGQRLRDATGARGEWLERGFWEVGDLRGRRARIEIVDEATGPWGHIQVDDFVLLD